MYMHMYIQTPNIFNISPLNRKNVLRVTFYSFLFSLIYLFSNVAPLCSFEAGNILVIVDVKSMLHANFVVVCCFIYINPECFWSFVRHFSAASGERRNVNTCSGEHENNKTHNNISEVFR